MYKSRTQGLNYAYHSLLTNNSDYCNVDLGDYMKLLHKILHWLGIVCTIAMIIFISYFAGYTHAYTRTQYRIPEKKDFQRSLNIVEPYLLIDVDGMIGPNTTAKWDRALANQFWNARFEEMNE